MLGCLLRRASFERVSSLYQAIIDNLALREKQGRYAPTGRRFFAHNRSRASTPDTKTNKDGRKRADKLFRREGCGVARAPNGSQVQAAP